MKMSKQAEISNQISNCLDLFGACKNNQELMHSIQNILRLPKFQRESIVNLLINEARLNGEGSSFIGGLMVLKDLPDGIELSELLNANEAIRPKPFFSWIFSKIRETPI